MAGRGCGRGEPGADLLGVNLQQGEDRASLVPGRKRQGGGEESGASDDVWLPYRTAVPVYERVALIADIMTPPARALQVCAESRAARVGVHACA